MKMLILSLALAAGPLFAPVTWAATDHTQEPSCKKCCKASKDAKKCDACCKDNGKECLKDCCKPKAK